MITKENAYDLFTEINKHHYNYLSLVENNDSDVENELYFKQCMIELANDDAVKELNEGFVLGLPLVSVNEDYNLGIIGNIISSSNKEHYGISDFSVLSMLYVTDERVKEIGCENVGGGCCGNYLYEMDLVTYITEKCEILMVEEIRYYIDVSDGKDVSDDDFIRLMVIRRLCEDEDCTPRMNGLTDCFDEEYSEVWDT